MSSDGHLANLPRETEFDLDANVVYLDMHQEEGTRGRSATSLDDAGAVQGGLQAHEGDGETRGFVIDEAHYLMSDANSLSFLKTAV